MKKTLQFITLIFVLTFFAACYEQNPYRSVQAPKLPENLTPLTMKITSTAFENNQQLPVKYTCDGDDVNPPLNFMEVPAETESLVMIVSDPDAPGGTWVHWTIFNIDPKTTEIAENSIPGGARQGQNSWNKSAYGGPCPPSGTHRYFFKLFALDTKLDLDETAKSIDIEQNMDKHILAQAQLIGLYSRE